MRCYYTYILSSKSRVLYIGITNNLERRLWEHRNAKKGFTADYKVTRLVYYEVFEDPLSAIYREKRLKKLYRRQKVDLIERENPAWDDLAADWF
jgi:putative endonuclease